MDQAHARITMKKRFVSIVLCIVMLLGMVAMAPISWLPEIHAATTSQNNIVARADYLYDATWVCQKTVTGWRGSYTFYAGNTYRIPYGQPVYAGAYVGFGVSVDDYLAAAANPNSVFYTSKSNYAGKTSTYYATDCSAYVSWCWGISRQTTATIPSVSTYIGSASQSNIVNYLQLGDCLNSNSAGHVVLVTGLTYSGSTLVQIEITEQTPPQLKRSYYTPAQLASIYSGSYGIYRYTGTVPAAPSSTNEKTTSFGVSVSEKLKNWVFDPVYYAQKYDDLMAAFGNNEAALYNHYLTKGITEGRQASPLFNIKYYLNQNAELKEVFGSDYEAAFSHFVSYGQYEASRVYSKQLTAIRDVIFDADFYRAKYPAETESFGKDVGRLFANFIKTGLSKGRTASPVFDISAYISGNSDLKKTYADDYYGAMRHFIENGQNESRVTSPIFDTTYYTGRYSNVAGLTTLAAMKHFLNTGMGKARQGCDDFDPKYYYFANAAKLGDSYTQSTCYIHYLLEGKAAGLRALPYGYLPEECADVGTGFIANLTNLKSGKNWSVSGSDVVICPASDTEDQKWKFIRQDDGSYEILNMGYGTVLTATYNGSSDGFVCLDEDTDSATQRWYLYEVSGYYTFRTACNDYVTIGLADGSIADGTAVELANYRDNEAQKYTITVLAADTQIENCDHSYISMVTKDPTCTTEGTRTCTCTGCGDSYTESVAATGHSYESMVTEPTCTDSGYTTHTCARCGDAYTDSHTAASGHAWMEAACTEPKTCADCGQIEGDPLGHSFEATVTPPTCGESGRTTFTCANCGYSYDDYIELPTGHSFEATVTAPTCDECGYTTYTCTGCGYSYTDYIVTPTGHSFEAVVTAPTGDECGYTTYTCAGCGYSYVDHILSPVGKAKEAD